MISVTYAQNLDDLNELDVKKSWQSEVIVRINGQKILGRASSVFKRYGRIRVGRCKYKVWVVDDAFELSDETSYFFRKYYAPDLGLVLRAQKREKSGRPISEVRFNKIARVE